MPHAIRPLKGDELRRLRIRSGEMASASSLIRATSSISSRWIGLLAHNVRTASTRRPTWSHYRLYRVNPNRVSSVMTTRLPDAWRGQVLGGGWDFEAIEIQHTALYRGLYQRFVDKRDWLDTDLRFDRYRIEYDNAPRKYLRFSTDEFLAQGARLDALYGVLRANGYRPHWKRVESFETELSVNIGREGQMIRNAGGLHRLIMSQFIGLEAILMRIVVIHQDLSHQLPASGLPEELYQEIQNLC
jgi:hypothetical protein